MNLITYLIHFLIYIQPLFFMYVYEYSVRRCEDNNFTNQVNYWVDNIQLGLLFYPISILSMIIVFISGISFEYYTNEILIQYIFLVIYFYSFNKEKGHPLKSIALSFLLVFFNSYLWEIVYHFTEYTLNPMMILKLRETYHLIILPFLFSHYRFKKKGVINKLYMLVFICFLFSVLNLDVLLRIRIVDYEFFHRIKIPLFNTMTNVLNFINRFVSLIFLIDIFNKDMIDKENRRWWFMW